MNLEDLGRFPVWVKEISIKELHAGAIIPTGYGIAWKSWDRATFVVMPMPFNLFVSWGRALWYGGMHGYTLDALAKANEAGYQEGKRDAEERASKHITNLAAREIAKQEANIRLNERIRVYKELEMSLDTKRTWPSQTE